MAEFPAEFPIDLGGTVDLPHRTVAAYARQLAQLLPPGLLWKLEPGSWLGQLLRSFAEELARIDMRGDVLVDEWDPRTALETLDDWERMLGITDPSTIPGERQAAITAAYLARGGATPAYFVALAARLGFVATVTETTPYTWRMDVDLAASPAGGTAQSYVFRAGAALAGDRVANRSVAGLEAAIRRYIPAHTVLLFTYV